MLMSVPRQNLCCRRRRCCCCSLTCCFPSFLYLCFRVLYLCETPLELCEYENATGSSINIRVGRKCAKCHCCTNKAEQVYITIVKTLSAYKSPRWPKEPRRACLTEPDIWNKGTYLTLKAPDLSVQRSGNWLSFLERPLRCLLVS